jgi:ADP-ribosyl-[dinitrogen reductase] hydrolase
VAGRPAGARATTAVPPPGRIAALYGARKQRITIDQALSDVAGVLPNANPNNDFRAALHRLRPTAGDGSS